MDLVFKSRNRKGIHRDSFPKGTLELVGQNGYVFLTPEYIEEREPDEPDVFL